MSNAGDRRRKHRDEFWPEEEAWTGDGEKGWYRAPRTLPLICTLVQEKDLSGAANVAPVLLGLYARHIDNGIVQIDDESALAYEAGYSGKRAVHTWRERMRILAELGFVRVQPVGNKEFGLVLLLHPTIVVQKLHDEGRIPDVWWAAYTQRLLECGARTFDRPRDNQKEDAAKSGTQGGAMKELLQRVKRKRKTQR